MSNFNVNISVEDILSQKEAETSKKTVNTFNVKNYLQARLADNEESKEITIRLLPFSNEILVPFKKIFMHQVRVPKEVSASGWKRFPCPVHNKLGDACPFCETATQAKALKKNAVSESEKKRFEEVEFANYARPMWIVRCIERGHEEDGVKFWLFTDSKNKDGVYDKIHAIFKKRLEKGKNIFDLNEGKDLCLTLTKDVNGKTRINITDEEDYTPLTDNYELGNAWINDSKTWNDVYTVKNYDYMSVIVKGGIPFFDKNSGKYVDKAEFENKEKAEIEANVTRPQNDLSIPTDTRFSHVTPEIASVPSSVIDDDDLPF